MAASRILGLFEKRIDGDDALLQLAKARFSRAGLGAEFYASSPAELGRLLQFKPSGDLLFTAHLPRGIDLLDGAGRDLVLRFAGEFGETFYGLVLHDQPEVQSRFEDYLKALRELETRLQRLPGSVVLFVEYAAGLHPDLFTEIFMEIRDLNRISCCIDTGHLGLWQVRRSYERTHPGRDVCSLRPSDPHLPDQVSEVQDAVASALGTLTLVIRKMGRVGKPVHFHLHDGHPLSTFSRFGVSDHLSFLSAIPIPFEYKGKQSLCTMYGPGGLERIIREAGSLLRADLLSFTLEIHPVEAEAPLDEIDNRFFDHWRDVRNARMMNHWLNLLRANMDLIDIAQYE